MSRKAKGNYTRLKGRLYARFSLGNGQRETVALTACTTDEEAERRTAVMADVVSTLRKADKIDDAPDILKTLGSVPEAKLERAVALVRGLCEGAEAASPKEKRTKPKGAMPTYEEWANKWLDGELAREHPDHVKALKHADRERERMRKHIFPKLGSKRLDKIELDDAEAVMRGLKGLDRGSRRLVAQLIARPLRLAVIPGRLLAHSPIPPGWLPRPPDRKAASFLYATEDLALLRHRPTPLVRRMFYGFLAREGMRRGEAAALEWSNVDLEVGSINLDKNKTNDPRFWALGADVAIALRRWKTICPSKRYVFPEAGKPIFVDHIAAQLRADLKAAGVTRESLFEDSETRMRLRAHDLRATFVTLSLAVDRSETWVADRTGHRSSQMINRYRRAARAAAELKLGWLAPMHLALPELAELVDQLADDGSEGFSPDPKTDAKVLGIIGEVRREGLEPTRLSAPEPKDNASETDSRRGSSSSSESYAEDEPPRPTADTSTNSANSRKRSSTPVAARGPQLRRAAREAVEAAYTGDPDAIDSTFRRFVSAYEGSQRERDVEPLHPALPRKRVPPNKRRAARAKSAGKARRAS